MKKIILFIICTVFLSSCGTPGPVYVAKNERDAMKTMYDDPQLKRLFSENEALLRGIYNRLSMSNVSAYNEGIGLTMLSDQKNVKLHYIMTNIRPSEIVFNENATKPEQRFSQVFATYFPKYLHYVKKEDLNREDIEGLALGIYWPVRDFTRCDTYGGFIEYIHAYFTREDIWDFLDGKKTFSEIAQKAEVITSLNLEPAKNVKPEFQ